MEGILEALRPYIIELLIAILTAIAGWIARKFNAKLKNEIARQIIKDGVKYAEQVGRALGGAEKYQMALDKISALLSAKGIKMSEDEIETLIESFVSEFKKGVE